jgi:hypothetical protein
VWMINVSLCSDLLIGIIACPQTVLANMKPQSNHKRARSVCDFASGRLLV